MQGSRHLEETKRTKFRGGREEQVSKKPGKVNKQNHRKQMSTRQTFDMWEEETPDERH